MLITHDLFDISSRLKEIDSSYTLHRNDLTRKFELHGKRDVVLIIFPYDRIDARMISHARRTRVERSRELIREIDEHNRRIEESKERSENEFFMESFKEKAGEYYAKRRKKYY